MKFQTGINNSIIPELFMYTQTTQSTVCNISAQTYFYSQVRFFVPRENKSRQIGGDAKNKPCSQTQPSKAEQHHANQQRTCLPSSQPL